MPSFKRVQVSQNPDDPSDDDSASAASGSSPPPSRKRPRTSATPASYESSDRETSANFDDEPIENEEDLEIRQTQIIQEKYAHITEEPNKPADQGILEKVECYNFMCHDHFSVELGPLINFIVGKNGSGKSAILTAITLCLGGKASATQRGGNLKSFIKQGKENATIIVHLKNQEEGAYMADDYGKTIIVERHFSRSGASSFKIKSANGRIVSNKKAELDAITDYFSLQIDNPMNVLSQDSARQFLSSSSPADKYKFFVKGVQLEQLDKDYRLIEESVDQVEEKLRSKAEDIRVLENRSNVAKRKLEISDQQASLRDRRKNIRAQMAWAQVEDQERARDAFGEDFTKAEEEILNAEEELKEFDEKFRLNDAESETAAECAYRADKALEDARGERETIQESHDAKMRERAELQAQQRQIREYAKAAESRMNEAQKNIDDENRRLAEMNDGSYARKQEECEQADRDAAEAKEKLEQHNEGESALKANIAKAEKDVQVAKTNYDNKKNDVQQAEDRLHSLRREDGQRRNGFHDKMPSLLRAIEKEDRFASRPIGPMGHHVTLLNQKWASILEVTLGGTLSAFLVSSKGDMNILSGLMRQVNCVCPIFIGSGGNLDTSGKEPDQQFDTFLRVLEIDNPMVRRQLIINHGIEQCVLIEDLKEASSTLFFGRERPRNVRRCYSINADDRRRGFMLSYNQFGDPNQSPVYPYNGHPRMKSDLAAQVSAQRELVQDLKRQAHEMENELQSARSHLRTCQQAHNRHGRESQGLKVSMQKMEDHVETLREALEKENATEDGRVDALRAAFKEAEEDKEVQEGSYHDSVQAMNDMVQSLKEIRRELAAKDQSITELVERSHVASSEQSLVAGKRRELFNDKNIAVADIERQKDKRDEIQESLELAEARVVQWCGKAEQVSPRVAIDEGETTLSLDHKLSKLNRDLDRYAQQLGGSRDEIAAEAGRAETAYVRAKDQVEELSTVSQLFKVTLHNRKKRWEIFRAHISSRAKAQFTYLLSERSFRGQLLTDHTNKILDLQVEPDITKDDKTGRGAKTLSGGEKSFSQICLLLALWEAMGSPIRCLDEFDVYMDHINRRMAIDMLMTAARRSIGRQFILITPGTKTDIRIAPDVRVKELAEPERGQTALTFQS
ncbi:hypothetical protein N7509_005352 [Penicillium cosmopolitanum]|uniref:RecF/RecN/SMC N-terminal domain-containing protein n=1 Tax=Penicillium cosmopolitanum TaxID=1131564 RepID=A0A9W9W211_9EURO|nr:uncharacterized protein N7509_005352 [Penicillium cosmopolitanum]KAJ5397239.1 hypothetical protein N7509_005352 [Penicillium cosmopolitanum]